MVVVSDHSFAVVPSVQSLGAFTQAMQADLICNRGPIGALAVGTQTTARP